MRSSGSIIAATHRPLAELVRAGRFREDLFYRLAVFPIEVPGLAERREDIPRLVDELVHAIARRLGIDPPRVPAKVMTRLVEHDWPGNVRELANVIEAALITSRGPALALPSGFPQRLRLDAAPTPSSETLDQATRRCIEAALAAANGRIYGAGGAAERLGLKPATLQSKMRKLGIRRTAFVRG
jgi:formate hydrogenlyase transcriptional activator